MARETYFPHLAILVPQRQSCACLRGQYALRKITRHSNHVPAAEQRPRHRRCPTSRDFVPWRFSDARRHSSWIASSCRHPKTCTRTDSCTAAKTSSHDRRSGLIIPFLNGSTVVIGSAEGSPASDARSVPRRAPTDRLVQLY